jgi:hypothetical protein
LSKVCRCIHTVRGPDTPTTTTASTPCRELGGVAVAVFLASCAFKALLGSFVVIGLGLAENL